LPLDDLLQSIQLSAVIKGTSHLTAPWGLESPAYEGTSVFHFIFEGRCIVRIPGAGQTIQLEAGDVLFMPRPYMHQLADAEGTPAAPLDKVLSEFFKVQPFGDEFLGSLFREPFVYGGGGARTHLESVRFFIDSRFPSALLGGLPSAIRLPDFAKRHQSFLDVVLHQMAEHGASGFVGQAIATRLCEAVFVLFLRDYLESTAQREPGIHRGLQDPLISKVIGMMQRSPGEHWTVEKLSEMAGMSRSAFAARFISTVGQSPAQLLTALRMARVRELLMTTRVPLTRIAAEAGYSSEAAFNRAFRRWSGMTPGALRGTREVGR
jgi:AraC family transcriptional activator of mtrCDE